MLELDPIAPETEAEVEDFAEGIGITIVGERLDPKTDTIKEERHHFTCSGVNPYGAFIDLMAAAGTIASLRAQQEYVEASLIDDAERERFREVTHSQGLRLNINLMDELSSLLVKAYAQRPTSPRSGSTTGARRGGRRSAGAARERASTSGNGRPT
jgi:hypothetical protein